MGSILSISSKSNVGARDDGKNQQNINKILEVLHGELADLKYQAVQEKAQEDNAADRLLKLKTLLDHNIIGQEEYESKKAEPLKLL